MQGLQKMELAELNLSEKIQQILHILAEFCLNLDVLQNHNMEFHFPLKNFEKIT